MLGYARVLNQSRGDLWEHPLRAGELVQLRSGSRAMVVSEVREGDGIVEVMWHDKAGVEHQSAYPPVLLRRAGRSFFGRRR